MCLLLRVGDCKLCLCSLFHPERESLESCQSIQGCAGEQDMLLALCSHSLASKKPPGISTETNRDLANL